LRKADERAERFKSQAEQLEDRLKAIQLENSRLDQQVKTREAEIQRLHTAYKGG